MSTLRSRHSGVEFIATPPPGIRAGSAIAHLVLGVLYPAAVIAFELATGLCAEALVDPMPSVWHLLAVAGVPVAILLVVAALWAPGGRVPIPAQWLLGVAVAVSGFYTLLFAPILPIALLAIGVGYGLLPFAPFATFVSSLALWLRVRRQTRQPASRRPLLAGVLAGLALLVGLDVPLAATRLGVQWAADPDPAVRERGIGLIRWLGDEPMLRRLCYDTGQPSGPLTLSLLVEIPGLLLGRAGPAVVDTARMREIYFRVTGEPFGTRPAPHRRNGAGFARVAFDPDLGGDAVGGQSAGLQLAFSHIDGSISAVDALAYLEWTFEVVNDAAVDREARLLLALPPGGVVSRATLWIDGEEREAAYAPAALARQAYQSVAVQQRRDPLLVTSKGAGRVLVQAFPVGARGGRMKFKVGITAPLTLDDPARAHLRLPAILTRNFPIPDTGTHTIWLESKAPIFDHETGLAASPVAGGGFRLEGKVADHVLGTRTPAIGVELPTAGPARLARVGDGESILQTLGIETPKPRGAVMLVVDGSRTVRPSAEAILEALRSVPPGAEVGLAVAGSEVAMVSPRPWSPAQADAVTGLLRSAAFSGGEDNGPALAKALIALETKADPLLIWVHGPQPVTFASGAGSGEVPLATALGRLPRPAQLATYALTPGPQELLPEGPWAWAATTLPATGDVAGDLAKALSDALLPAPRPTVHRSRAAAGLATSPPPAGEAGSAHIARLWASERVSELIAVSGSRPEALDEAKALAVRYQLVTPLSGAVVLQTAQQYEAAGLSPASPLSVPTVPEPHEWALMLLAVASLGWIAWRRRAIALGAGR